MEIFSHVFYLFYVILTRYSPLFKRAVSDFNGIEVPVVFILLCSQANLANRFLFTSSMYTLLSGLYKYMFQKDEYCILILGLDNAGKTVNNPHSF